MRSGRSVCPAEFSVLGPGDGAQKAGQGQTPAASQAGRLGRVATAGTRPGFGAVRCAGPVVRYLSGKCPKLNPVLEAWIAVTRRVVGRFSVFQHCAREFGAAISRRWCEEELRSAMIKWLRAGILGSQRSRFWPVESALMGGRWAVR